MIFFSFNDLNEGSTVASQALLKYPSAYEVKLSKAFFEGVGK